MSRMTCQSVFPIFLLMGTSFRINTWSWLSSILPNYKVISVINVIVQLFRANNIQISMQKHGNQRNNDLKGEIHVFQVNSSCEWTYTKHFRQKTYSPGTCGHSELGNETVHT